MALEDSWAHHEGWETRWEKEQEAEGKQQQDEADKLAIMNRQTRQRKNVRPGKCVDPLPARCAPSHLVPRFGGSVCSCDGRQLAMEFRRQMPRSRRPVREIMRAGQSTSEADPGLAGKRDGAVATKRGELGSGVGRYVSPGAPPGKFSAHCCRRQDMAARLSAPGAGEHRAAAAQTAVWQASGVVELAAASSAGCAICRRRRSAFGRHTPR